MHSYHYTSLKQSKTDPIKQQQSTLINLEQVHVKLAKYSVRLDTLSLSYNSSTHTYCPQHIASHIYRIPTIMPSRRGTCTCKSSMARQLYLCALAGLALLNTSTVACTPSLSPAHGLYLSRAIADTGFNPIPVPPRLSRRSPSPQSGIGITLADPSDTSSTSTTASSSSSSDSTLPAGYSFPQPFE